MAFLSLLLDVLIGNELKVFRSMTIYVYNEVKVINNEYAKDHWIIIIFKVI